LQFIVAAKSERDPTGWRILFQSVELAVALKAYRAVAVRPGEIKALVEWDGRDWFILAQATGSDAEALTEHGRADATEQART
jgi:hypothetical protein